MHLTATNTLAALLWCAVAGIGTWFVLTPVRRHSFTGLLAALVLTGSAASTGALLGGVHTMLVPAYDWRTLLVLTVGATAITCVAAVAAARRFGRDTTTLRAAVAEIGEGRVPVVDGPRLSPEVESIRQELHMTAAALAETREREQSLEKARRELVSWVSHDLRTPLAGLRAMAEALEDGVADNPELYYKQIGASVERLNQMVEDLFDLSRIQAGVVSREVANLSLDDLVTDCVTSLQPLATAQDISLVGTVAGVTSISGDAPELNRALTNLVANAIRHTRPEGQVNVRVGLTRAEPTPGVPFRGHGPLAEVIVSDECGGIPDEHLSRLFDVGFRGEAARTPRTINSAGAGLGLAITRGIVEAHSGTVDVRNARGGCQFRILLPARVTL
ncbi:HAMP domain-containing sensor histidine kinase [Jatrophihabitans endophyticus]|uniref:sensor histidine kinase n=1 Tax=Jatrophihabitans endophyticus TaxID=1206085 RepID=UPI0019FD953C|nr:HAMP domain-containing sensor histidine kinase [Jatrophihabitans endophyticus]MBE7190036.1 HAMP domain-containing histidine kinase [Jatrophihabitans endophyticus]